jgi:CO/xanthine dehydrogenase FAD-binding subunit
MGMSWHHPDDVGDALRLIGLGCTPVAGGAALFSPAFACELGTRLVDIKKVVPAGTSFDDGGPVIGGSTTLAAIAADRTLALSCPAIGQAARATANPEVRNIATFGGSIAARLPTSDLAAALAAHGARVRIRTVGRPSELIEEPIAEYFGSGAREPHLVLGARLTLTGISAYRRFAPLLGPAPAFVTVAALRSADGEITCWAGASGPTPAPVPFATGSPLGVEHLRSDQRASAWYRARVLAALTGEVLDEIGAGV